MPGSCLQQVHLVFEKLLSLGLGPGCLHLAAGAGGETRELPLLGAVAVELEEAGEDLVADVVGPAVTPRFLAAATAPAARLLLVVEEELAARPKSVQL